MGRTSEVISVSSDRSIDEAGREPRESSGVRTVDDETSELLAAIRRGDADAFDRVAREFAPRLFRMALRLTGRREEAEDLVQETLLRTLPALRRFEGRARLSTYLFRALGNLWKNRLRSRKRSKIVEWFRARRDDDPGAETDEPVALDPAPSAEGTAVGDGPSGECSRGGRQAGADAAPGRCCCARSKGFPMRRSPGRPGCPWGRFARVLPAPGET